MITFPIQVKVNLKIRMTALIGAKRGTMATRARLIYRRGQTITITIRFQAKSGLNLDVLSKNGKRH